jgi:hypothetical protein
MMIARIVAGLGPWRPLNGVIEAVAMLFDDGTRFNDSTTWSGDSIAALFDDSTWYSDSTTWSDK